MDSLETQAKNKYDCQKINNMVPNDFLLYSETIAYSYCHQGGFTKQLLETAVTTKH